MLFFSCLPLTASVVVPDYFALRLSVMTNEMSIHRDLSGFDWLHLTTMAVVYLTLMEVEVDLLALLHLLVVAANHYHHHCHQAVHSILFHADAMPHSDPASTYDQTPVVG